jgi:STE24 endopeptidase
VSTRGDLPAPRPRVPWTWWVAAVVVVVGVVVNAWRPWASPVPPVVTDLDRLAPEVVEAIAAYREPRRALSLGLTLLGVVVPVAVVTTAPGRRLLARVAGRGARGWRGCVRGALVAVVVTGLVRAVGLPVVAWAGIVQDGTWEIRTAGPVAWWGRLLTGIGIELVTVAAVGAAMVWLVRRRPRAWPGDAVLLGVAGVAIATVVWPSVVLPLTTPVAPLGDGPQARAVRQTVERAGLGELPVVVQERSRRDLRSNAVVHGLGPSRRVVIDDSLLARPVDEVVAVTAHELAHQQRRDVERAVLGSGVAVAALAGLVHALWRRGSVRSRLALGGGDVPVDDPRVVAVALAVLAVASLVGEPLGYWQSRRVEAAADDAAYAFGADPATTVALQRRLAIDNLSPVDVPAWERWTRWTHPTPGQRIRTAAARAALHGEPLPALEDLLEAEAGDPPRWWPPPGR